MKDVSEKIRMYGSPPSEPYFNIKLPWLNYAFNKIEGYIKKYGDNLNPRGLYINYSKEGKLINSGTIYFIERGLDQARDLFRLYDIDILLFFDKCRSGEIENFNVKSIDDLEKLRNQ